MDYQGASRAVANSGLGLGIAGTALGLMNGGASLLGMGGNIEDRHVTRHEMDLIREIQNKDQQIAIANSENYTDKKLVEVYTQLAKQDKEIREKIDANYKEQQGINMQQAVYNGTNNATLACMRNQIDALAAMTKMVIPADNVCPKPMPQFNSWTAPTT